MMIKPKRIGDDLTLDEYNACQHLLYNMNCWTDYIILNTYTAYKGTFATYKLQNNNALLNEKQTHYRINTTPSTTTNTLKIELKDISPHLEKLNLTPTVTIAYKKPKIYKNDENEPTEYDATDYKDINQWGKEESKETPDSTDYTRHTVPTTLNGNTLTFQLVDEEGTLLPQNTIIKQRIILKYKLNSKPYIDFRNGKANNMNEILVDNQEELIKLIENAPTNGKLTTIRLDSNIVPTKPKNTQSTDNMGTYYIEKTITIQKGQNIELLGGTNNNAIINASLSHRCFIIQPGAKLSLNHITCEYANVTKEYYNKGKGGAILVENENKEYGTLECENCTFQYNTAWYGGAIYSYHSGLHINNCTFTDNTATYSGGAINYMAQDVQLYFKNIITPPDTVVTLQVEVKDMNQEYKNEGEIEYYIRNNETDTYIGKSRVRQGISTLDYTVPKTLQTTEYIIVAKYTGGRAIDDDVAIATLTVKVPETYKASWIEGNVVKAKIGETITLNAKITDSNGLISTTPQCEYIINNNTIIATQNGNTYQLKYTLTEHDIINENNEFIAKFTTVPSSEYTCNTITAKITIDTEKQTNVQGYVTGLFVNSNTTVTTSLVDSWINAGITDVFIRYVNYKNSTNRQLLETTIKAAENKNINIHATINCYYDTATSKWITPTDTTRNTFLKEHINYIAEHYSRVNGICLDYFRYPGTSPSSTAHTTITNQLKTLQEHIKSKNKNYIISTAVMPEEDGASEYYGQNYKEMSEYVDYLHIMAYKGNYSINGKERDDSWIKEKVTYCSNKNINLQKIVISLQTYKSDNNLTVRTKEELTTTAKTLKSDNIRGISLFREGLAPTGYIQSFKSIMEG